MNTALSLPPRENLDTVMLKVARELAMDIYELEDILKNNDLTPVQFSAWERHPQFIKYLQSEKEAWNSASNTAERTKLKAGVVMEMFMENTLTELQDRKTPLNQRVELAKVMARLAGLAAPNGGLPVSGGSGGFKLQINIGAGIENMPRQQITISANSDAPNLDHDTFNDGYVDDDYNPFVSPNTLED